MRCLDISSLETVFVEDLAVIRNVLNGKFYDFAQATALVLGELLGRPTVALQNREKLVAIILAVAFTVDLQPFERCRDIAKGGER